MELCSFMIFLSFGIPFNACFKIFDRFHIYGNFSVKLSPQIPSSLLKEALTNFPLKDSLMDNNRPLLELPNTAKKDGFQYVVCKRTAPFFSSFESSYNRPET